MPGVQAPRQRLRAGCRRACPRPAHADRLRSDLPRLWPRLLRCFGPGEAKRGQPAPLVRRGSSAVQPSIGCSRASPRGLRPSASRRAARSRPPRRSPADRCMSPATSTSSGLTPSRGEGRLSLAVWRDAGGDRARPRDLRGAALLRATGRWPSTGRGDRHRRADLRDLPRRVPDVSRACIRAPVRRRDRPRGPAPAQALLTAASGSRATHCTSTCSMRPTSGYPSAIELPRTTLRSSSEGCA